MLIKRIYEYTDIVASRHKNIEFVKASYLNDHPLVLDTFAERVQEIRNGMNNMNCQLCKYREQFLGFEDEVGLRQESHHHHVEGIGTGFSDKGKNSQESKNDHDIDQKHSHNHTHPHEHHHDHEHGHGHIHHPYPHANHPLGPRTLK